MSGSVLPATAGARAQAAAQRPNVSAGHAAWWALLLLTALAAALRLPTLGSQSLWYDEAFTPVHVLHSSLGATLHAVAHTENAPPLWYVLEWALTRVLGSGAVALRLLSALAGIATVPVAWAIGRELAGRRAAIATAAFVAVNPLLVWYSQEARAYGLFVLTAALAMLCFLRALREPTARRMLAFALTASLALLTHYFAVFLLAPMVLWLAVSRFGGGAPAVPAAQTPSDGQSRKAGRRGVDAGLLGIAIPLLVGAALIPLVVTQAGHGTQWIGRWALSSRLAAIPQYYLTGYTGSALGHGIELLVALVILAGVANGLWHVLEPREERGALIALAIVACGVLTPVALAIAGADYLAPRNLVAAMVPLSALLAIAIAPRRAGWTGMALAGLLALVFAALTVDIALSPRLQRGDWAGVAAVLRGGGGDRVITTPELGAAPLEYYLPPLRNLARGAHTRIGEVDEVGYSPLSVSAGRPPARGLKLLERRDVHGLIVYRFTSTAPVTISEAALRRAAITQAHPEVLTPMPTNGKN